MRSRTVTIPIMLFTLALGGCEFVANFISGPADEQLVEGACRHGIARPDWMT